MHVEFLKIPITLPQAQVKLTIERHACCWDFVKGSSDCPYKADAVSQVQSCMLMNSLGFGQSFMRQDSICGLVTEACTWLCVTSSLVVLSAADDLGYSNTFGHHAQPWSFDDTVGCYLSPHCLDPEHTLYVPTAITRSDTGSYSQLHVPDPTGRHMLHEQMNAYMASSPVKPACVSRV